MLLRIDPTSSVALYDQLASAIRGGVASGAITSGERLPAARDLADSLGINVHTVLKAYADLRDEGLLQVRRGRGAVVTDVRPGEVELSRAVAELLAVGRRNGLSLKQIHHAIDQGAGS